MAAKLKAAETKRDTHAGEVKQLIESTEGTLKAHDEMIGSFGRIIDGITEKFDKIS